MDVKNTFVSTAAMILLVLAVSTYIFPTGLKPATVAILMEARFQSAISSITDLTPIWRIVSSLALNSSLAMPLPRYSFATESV